MDETPKQSGLLRKAMKAVLTVIVLLGALFGFSLLQIWDCAVCRNPHPGAFIVCPYCNHTGKQNLIQRVLDEVELRKARNQLR